MKEPLCSYCGENPRTRDTVFCAKCLRNRPSEFKPERLLEIGKKIRAKIAAGSKLILDDSNVIGAKHTHASWGFCCDEADVYDQPLDHIWPAEFKEHGRVAPLSRPRGMACPFRQAPEDGNGCFWSCKLFQSDGRIKRKTALAHWDGWIADKERRASGPTDLRDDRGQYLSPCCGKPSKWVPGDLRECPCGHRWKP